MRANQSCFYPVVALSLMYSNEGTESGIPRSRCRYVLCNAGLFGTAVGSQGKAAANDPSRPSSNNTLGKRYNSKVHEESTLS
jgi:hypothetical protein